MRLDHQLYVSSRKYRRQVHAHLRRLIGLRSEGHAAALLARLTIVHETNLSCCEWQPWDVTLARIVQALADDGLPTLGLHEFGRTP